MPGGASHAPGALRRLQSRDRIAIAILVALPILIYVPFTLAGHPVVPGDDLTQNYPLRVLSGQLLRSGRLPSWDNLIWSGTPLLAGWNAGAMFPGTWLFSFVPAIWAWTANFATVPIVCGIGTYVLLRRFSCQVPAAFLGALAFSYTGFMSGQFVHIGLVQGSALLPWLVLGVDGVARTSGAWDRLPWVALIGAAFGLAILAGDPRSVSNGAIVVVVCLAATVVRAPRAALGRIGGTLSGMCLGVVLAGIQLIPGISFVHSSQRQSADFGFFGSGSLPLGTIARYLLVPFIFGGNGNFGLPTFIGSYNLPELTIGVGFVALLAMFILLPELTASAVAFLRRTPRVGAKRRPLGVWYVLGLVGALLTMGSTTPLGKVFFLIPFFGGERLQNRNVILLDLALCVLLAFFVDDVFRWSDRRGTKTSRQRTHLVWWSPHAVPARVLSVVPGLSAVALIAYALLRPTALYRAFGHTGGSPSIFHRLSPYLIATAVLAIAVCSFGFFSKLLSPRVARCTICILVIFDVVSYLANSNFATTSTSVVAATNPLSDAVARVIGPNGRFAVFNPSLAPVPNEPEALKKIGVADLNILHGIQSIQGYGSIIDGTYQEVTGTHLIQYVDPKRLTGNTYNTLDLRALLAVPSAFGVLLPPHRAVPVAGGSPVSLNGQTSTTEQVASRAPNASGPWAIAPGGRATFTLSKPMSVTSADVVLDASPTSVASVQLQLTSNQHSSDKVARSVVGDVAKVSFPHFDRATQVVIENPTSTSFTVGAVVITTKQPAQQILLDGALQNDLSAPHWNYAGAIGPFSTYTNSETLGLAWLQPGKSSTPSTDLRLPGTVRLLNANSSERQRLLVSSPSGAALLVRSETYSPGWSATITPANGGATRTVRVLRFGLIQAVDLPEGAYQVTFTYAPARLVLGLVSTFVGTFIFIVLIVLAVRRRRDRTVALGAGT